MDGCGSKRSNVAETDLAALRQAIRAAAARTEAQSVRALLAAAPPAPLRRRIEAAAIALVQDLRDRPEARLMENFLAEYGLSTTEGIALMCLAEALLRVPDAPTVDALIRDKIAPADWSRHLGQSSSPLVNASTWALMLTGRVLGGDVAGSMRGLLRRAGEPLVRRAVGQAMRVMGDQFVLGESIGQALDRADPEMQQGVLHSFDMLGEAARTADDARRYFLAYSAAIAAIAGRCRGQDARANPGISIKLSALHPRYETAQHGRVMAELVPRVAALAQHARAAGMGFNIDAEEQDRLELSLDVIQAVLQDPGLAGWNGFGAVVQAYGRRAPAVLDWFAALAARLRRQVMVRLVKGAYWDTEIKHAQVLGVPEYPVFTRKASSDASYIACAAKLLGMRDRVYPQFATHNAHTIAAVLELAGNGGDGSFEFQRLHGMGEALHSRAGERHGQRLRVYAPVGVHEDLLAYLVRRLLENGANSSFVHQILDLDVPPERIARDPFDALLALDAQGTPLANPAVPTPPHLLDPRANARGWNLAEPAEAEALLARMAPWRTATWGAVAGREVRNPADPADLVGRVQDADPAAIEAAIAAAAQEVAAWAARPAEVRAAVLERAADLVEDHAPELIALCAREAGKTLPDGVAELREAVDFLRYYAAEARRLDPARAPWGVFACISPWNFPLAIFTGQVAAALAAGNAVLAKPAEQTPLVAARAIALLHEAGVPRRALHLLNGAGQVGAALVGDPRVAGVCFTGSTETARRIEAAMAQYLNPGAPLIAETGGLNAMIVDSTALPEQAVRDVVAAAFQSAGQRCSAARLLCVQEDVADGVLRMLAGAAAELAVGDPWQLATDVGPVIDDEARDAIAAHCAALDAQGRRLFRLDAPDRGSFVGPAAYRLDAVESLEKEVFGPVLHVATFQAHELDALVDRINARGYGLTLGLHTRLDDRVRRVVERARVGNIYVNRNQIGAVVGVQPFGGEGLSGTGPKAGGPHYLLRFTRPPAQDGNDASLSGSVPADPAIAARLRAAQPAWDRCLDRPALIAQAAEACGPTVSRATELALARAAALHVPDALPGPVGESNRLSLHGRGLALVLGADPGRVFTAAVMALALGNTVLASESPDLAGLLAKLPGGGMGAGACTRAGLTALLDGPLDLVVLDADADTQRQVRLLLADRPGPIARLVIGLPEPYRLVVERTVSVDLTAAGGNAQLLALV